MNDIIGNESMIDELLKEALPPDVPEDMMRDISPWKRIMKVIFAGIAISIAASELFRADVFFGIIGAVLCAAGFAGLRKENRGFFLCSIFSIIKAGICFTRFAFPALSKYAGINTVGMETAWYYINKLLMAAILLSFFSALEQVEQKSGAKISMRSAGRLALWYIATQLLMVWESGVLWVSPFIFLLRLAIAAAAVLCIHSVYCLIKELEVPGYAVRTVPRRLPVHTVAVIALAVSAALFALSVLVSSVDLKWSAVPGSFSAEAQAVREELSVDQDPSMNTYEEKDEALAKRKRDPKGIPYDITAMLTEEQILACKGGVSYMLEDVVGTTQSGKTIRPFCYAVARNDGTGRWIIISGMIVNDEKFCRLTDGISVEGYDICSGHDVRLYYTNGESAFAAELQKPDLTVDLRDTEYYDTAAGRPSETEYYSFSLPKDAESAAVVVFYEMDRRPGDAYGYLHTVTYSHRISPRPVPFLTGADVLRSSGRTLRNVSSKMFEAYYAAGMFYKPVYETESSR